MSSVERVRVIRAGTTMRDPEAWSMDSTNEEHRSWEQFLDTYPLATVTLIQAKDTSILVDTAWEGSMLYEDHTVDSPNRLMMELEYAGLSPNDIQEIFVTHWHGDHFLNLPLFPDARVVYAGCSPSFVKDRLKSMGVDNEILKLKDGEEWHPGIEVMATTGHSDHDHSLVVNCKDKDFVIVGDSIVSKMYYHTETFFPNQRMEDHLDELKASFDRIVERADIIMPGHDGPFYNYRRSD